MEQASILKDIFQIWYQSYKSRFSILPERVRYIDGSDRIELWLSGDHQTNLVFILERENEYYRIELVAMYSGEVWDIAAEFDVFAARNEDGQYYCSECKAEYLKLYQSRTELVENHSLNKLLEWINEYYIPSNYLVFYGEPKRWSKAEIADKAQLAEKMKDKNYVHSILLIDCD